MTLKKTIRGRGGVARNHRRWIALGTAAAVGAGGALVAQPAMAATGEDSWLTMPAAGVHRFTVPAADADAAVGTTPAAVAVEGNLGQNKAWAQLNSGLSNGAWTSTVGPLEPGLYYYQYTATLAGSGEQVGFRNPDSPQSVTSKPATLVASTAILPRMSCSVKFLLVTVSFASSGSPSTGWISPGSASGT